MPVQLPWDATWSLPTSSIVRLIRRADLEELATQPWAFDQLPQAEALSHTPRAGKSIEGRPLRPGYSAGVMPQGIGVLAPTVLSREISGPGTLLVSVGVDQEVASFRNPQPVRFQVLFNSSVLMDAGSMTWKDGTQSFLVEVPAAGTVQLQTKPAEVLPYGGHGDWCVLAWRPARD